MFRCAFTACAFVLCAASGLAKPSPLEPPLAGQPTNFSRLIGRFTIDAKVEPTEAIVEDPLVLRVTIKGDIAAGEPPTREHLRLFTDIFAESFYLEAVPERDSLRPEEKTWDFVWKLRPKTTDVRELPSLALVYYSPPVRRYQTVRNEPIALTIKPRPKIAVESNELRSAPEGFLELAEWLETPSPWRVPSRRPTDATVLVVLAMILAALSWRRGSASVRRESAERRAQQSRWSASAVAELQREPADPAAVATRFLQARFGLAAVEPSTADIQSALKRNGIAAPVRERWTNWYCAVAARRFAPVSMDRSSNRDLIDEAIALIQSVEAQS